MGRAQRIECSGLRREADAALVLSACSVPVIPVVPVVEVLFETFCSPGSAGTLSTGGLIVPPNPSTGTVTGALGDTLGATAVTLGVCKTGGPASFVALRTSAMA